MTARKKGEGADVRRAEGPVPAVFAPPKLADAWAEALEVWGVNVTLTEPISWAGSQKKDHWQGDEPLAFIDMKSRQVVVNYVLLDAIGASRALVAVLAHEVGHHVRFPHSLGLAARLELLEKRLLPGLGRSLTNLFFDLQVNEVVGRERADDLCLVYRGFRARDQGPPAPMFAFYLAIYEELWGREVGELVGAEHLDGLEAAFPAFRVEARVFAQTFYALPDVYLQFVYFCSRFARFVVDQQNLGGAIALGADVGAPSVDDYSDALVPNPLVERALAEAADRGWLTETDATGVAASADAFADIERACQAQAGHGRGGQSTFRRALVDAHYARLVEQHLFVVPETEPGPDPDPFIPTTVADWDWGDDPRRIDWTESILRRGQLAGAMPVMRELEPEEPRGVPMGLPSVEIYVDTSGSMPNPLNGFNAMTLAAQVLSASCIRQGGRVRGVIYSSGKPLVSDWMYDEGVARRFLMHFAGGGTEFPFDVLDRFSGEDQKVARVVISDNGFFYDLRRDGAKASLARAVQRSHVVVAMLLLWYTRSPNDEEPLNDVRDDPRFRFVPVADGGKLGEAARALADALFESRKG